MLTEDDLRQIEEIVKKHKPDCGHSGCVTILMMMILFILGVFKGC